MLPHTGIGSRQDVRSLPSSNESTVLEPHGQVLTFSGKAGQGPGSRSWTWQSLVHLWLPQARSLMVKERKSLVSHFLPASPIPQNDTNKFCWVTCHKRRYTHNIQVSPRHRRLLFSQPPLHTWQSECAFHSSSSAPGLRRMVGRVLGDMLTHTYGCHIQAILRRFCCRIFQW